MAVASTNMIMRAAGGDVAGAHQLLALVAAERATCPLLCGIHSRALEQDAWGADPGRTATMAADAERRAGTEAAATIPWQLTAQLGVPELAPASWGRLRGSTVEGSQGGLVPLPEALQDAGWWWTGGMVDEVLLNTAVSAGAGAVLSATQVMRLQDADDCALAEGVGGVVGSTSGRADRHHLRLASARALNPLLARCILLPINTEGVHWTAAAALRSASDLPVQRWHLFFMDPLGGLANAQPPQILRAARLLSRVLGAPVTIEAAWALKPAAATRLRQQDGCNCGLAALQLLENARAGYWNDGRLAAPVSLEALLGCSDTEGCGGGSSDGRSDGRSDGFVTVPESDAWDAAFMPQDSAGMRGRASAVLQLGAGGAVREQRVPGRRGPAATAGSRPLPFPWPDGASGEPVPPQGSGSTGRLWHALPLGKDVRAAVVQVQAPVLWPPELWATYDRSAVLAHL